MRILIVASFIPYPPDSGARIRTWEIARRLRKDHQVTFGLHVRSSADLGRVEAVRKEGFEVVTGRVNRGLRAAWVLGSELFSGAPPLIGLRRSHELEKQLARMHAERPFDIVQIEHFELARYGKLIGVSSRSVQSMVLHDVLSVSYGRMAAIKAHPFWKFWRWYNAVLLRKYERKLLPDYDVCITVSGKDRDEISGYVAPDKIEVLPNCVDARAKPFLPESASGPPVLLFVGLLLYPPNADAARWMIEKILPKVHAVHPDCRLHVVGAGAPRVLRELAGAHPAVTLTGRIEDLRPSYASCRVAVVPLRAGSGTRLKILEAMAFGRAVVSTALGAEGLAVENAEHLLLAETAEDFAAAIIRMIENPSLRETLRQNARDFVEREHSWDRCAHSHILHYQTLIDQKS